MKNHIVNVVDDSPLSLYEICNLLGSPIKPSSAPLENPWEGLADGDLARSFGFNPQITTARQEIKEGIL